MKNVLILGGSFNPITNEHLNIVRKVLRKLNIDEVYFLIAKNPRWKESLDVSHRLKMLKLALKNYPKYKVLDIELKSDSSVNYTYDSMKLFKTRNKKIYYIIGSDQLNKLHEWYNIDLLKDLVTFVLIRRKGYRNNKKNILKYNVLDLNIKGDETSSTLIRQYLSNNAPKEVMEYIYNHHLYLEESLKVRLDEHRFNHSLSVASLAKEIALSNNIDTNKAYIAGLLHDVAKCLPYSEASKIMHEHFSEYLNKNKSLYHQYIGSLLVQEIYHIKDKDIIEAIKYHTTANLNLATLGKIIFVSDKLDPLRGYDSSKLINLCKLNIEVGYNNCLFDNHEYLINHNVALDKESEEIYMKALKENELLLLKAINDTILDKKGENITIIDMKEHSADFSYFIICSCDNARLASTIAYEIEDKLAELNYNIKRIEGRNDNEWVLVDANDYIIHIFVKEARNKYNLEKLYSDLKRVELDENN